MEIGNRLFSQLVVLFSLVLLSWIPPLEANLGAVAAADLRKRFNYASFDCAARILATNKGSKSPTNILHEQKDQYLLNHCAYPDKHVILELCQDIRVDTLVLANHEYFSSMIRQFDVYLSKKYPPPPEGGWQLVGRFTAANNRQEQVFRLDKPTMFARFMRIDFKNHYGNEYYCPISLLRVHGKTMMDDFEESKSVTTTTASPATAAPQAAGDANAVADEHAVIPYKSDSERMELLVKKKAFPKKEVCPVTIEEHPAHNNENNENNEHSEYQEHNEHESATTKSSTHSSSNPSSNNSNNNNNAEPQQENIFKAIYDRLEKLERNQTRCTRKIDLGMRRIEDKLLGWWMQRVEREDGGGGGGNQSSHAKEHGHGYEEHDEATTTTTISGQPPAHIPDHLWSQRSYGMRIHAYLLKGLVLRTEAVERMTEVMQMRLGWLERILMALAVVGLFQGVLLLRLLRRRKGPRGHQEPVNPLTQSNKHPSGGDSTKRIINATLPEKEIYFVPEDDQNVPSYCSSIDSPKPPSIRSLLDGQPPIFDDPETDARIEARYPESPVSSLGYSNTPTNRSSQPPPPPPTSAISKRTMTLTDSDSDTDYAATSNSQDEDINV